MRCLTVVAHPLEGSLSHRFAALARNTLEAAGHAVSLTDLYAEGFDPRLTAAERLAALRDEEGYMAESSRLDDGAFLLVENRCPTCAAARACQNFCRSELGIFRAALGPDVRIERAGHMLSGSRRCAYRITPREEPRT